MSKTVRWILILSILLAGGFYLKGYLKDKIPSIKSDLSIKENRELLYKFLKLNDKRAVFCDIVLDPSQNEQFEEDLNITNRVYVDGLLEKKVKYIFITPENSKREFFYDKDKKRLQGLFFIDSYKTKAGDRIELNSITPKDLNKLNNF